MNFSEEVKTTLWDFPTLMKFIISMESQSLENELHKYFEYTTECPMNASFNQKRAQISSDAFKDFFLLHHTITITLIFTKDIG